MLAEHPDVEDVAVIGVPDAEWGERVLAAVKRRDGASVGASELSAFARERLADYKCPRDYEFVDDFPRDQAGKLVKRVLREPYWAEAGRRL